MSSVVRETMKKIPGLKPAVKWVRGALNDEGAAYKESTLCGISTEYWAQISSEFWGEELESVNSYARLVSKQSPRTLFVDGMVEGWGPQFAKINDKVKARYPDIDEVGFWDIAKDAMPHTALSVQRLYAIFKTIEYIGKNNVPGDVVECGVFKGGAAIMLIRSLAHFGLSNRKVFLFDTFDGWPRPSEEDTDIFGTTHSQNYDLEIQKNVDQSTYRLENFFERTKSAVMAAAGSYPVENIKWIKGMVEQTIPCPELGAIAVLRLDTDYYESTKWELENLYPLVSQFGAVLVDDYGQFHGARKAVDQYLSAIGVFPFMNRDDFSGRSFLKIGR